MQGQTIHRRFLEPPFPIEGDGRTWELARSLDDKNSRHVESGGTAPQGQREEGEALKALAQSYYCFVCKKTSDNPHDLCFPMKKFGSVR